MKKDDINKILDMSVEETATALTDIFKDQQQERIQIEIKRTERMNKFIEDVIAILDEETALKVHKLAADLFLDTGNILLGKQ